MKRAACMSAMTVRLFTVGRMKLQKVKVVFVFVEFLTAGACLFANSLAPSEYTITTKMVSLWLSSSGEVITSNQIFVRVAIDQARVIIQPWACDGTENLVFFTWATSPFRTNEWIVGGQSQGLEDVITNVFVNNHPIFGAQDTYANLARILYLPESHSTYRGIPSCERLYIPIESSFYEPEEISFEIGEMMLNNKRLTSCIVAVSPPYYYRPEIGGKTVRVGLRGIPPTRKLWSLTVTEFTNWHGIVLPFQFSYMRYQDPAARVDADEEKPVVLVTGSLVAAELGAETDIRPRLSDRLSVADLRVTPVLGRAVRYTAPPGGWPETNSKEYEQLLATNKALIASSILSPPVNQPPVMWRTKIVQALLVFTAMTVIPILALYRLGSSKLREKKYNK